MSNYWKISNFVRVLKAIRVVALFILIFFCVNVPQALAHTPHDDVFQVEISPQYEQNKTLFIIVRGNLLKSDDGGKNWQRIIKGLDHKRRLYSLDIADKSPKTLFLSSLGDGIYKSQDGGTSWSQVNNGLDNLNIDLVAIATYNPNLVLAAGTKEGLYQTENGGENWYPVIKKHHKITAIAFSPNQKNIFVGDSKGNLYLLDTKGNIIKSDVPIPQEGGISAIAISPNYAQNQTLYIATEKGSIIRSIDGGGSFAQIDSNISHPAISSLAATKGKQGKIILLATTQYDGVFTSENGGRSWQLHDKGLTADPQAHKLNRPYFSEVKVSPAFARDRTLFLAGYDGLFKSQNGGQKWQELETLSTKTIVGLGLSPNYQQDATVAVGTYVWGAYLSTQAGTNWQEINQGLEESQRIKQGVGTARVFDLVFSPNYATDNTIFSTTWYGISKTTDRGKHWQHKSWQQIQPSDRSWWPTRSQCATLTVSPDYQNDRTLWLGTKDGHIITSTDGGKTFSLLTQLDKGIISLAVSPNYQSDRTIYASIANQVYKSVDRGKTWQPASKGLVFQEELSDEKEANVRLVISPNYTVDKTIFATTAEGVFVTNNQGGNWSRLVNTPYGDRSYIEGIALSPNYAQDGTVLVSVRGKGLFKSVDRGQNFNPIGNNLIDNNYVFSNLYGFPLTGISTPIQFSPSYATDKTIYGFADIDLFKSTDSGVTWEAVAIEPLQAKDNFYLAYRRFQMSHKLVFLAALVIALLSYLLLGYLQLSKKLASKKILIKLGGTLVAFILSFALLSA